MKSQANSIVMSSEFFESFKMSDEEDEQYDLVEIFSIEMITEKRAKLCTYCGKRVACCIWKSTMDSTRRNIVLIVRVITFLNGLANEIISSLSLIQIFLFMKSV